MSLIKGVPAFDFDPYDDDSLSDPFPHYAEMRKVGPIVRLPRYDVLAMSRHREVFDALRDWQTYSSAAGVGLDDLRQTPGWRPASLLLEVDPPIHDRARTVMNGVLSLPAVRRMQQDFAVEAERLVDELVEKREFDAMQDFVAPFILKVFPDAVGIVKEGRENLLPWGDMIFNSFGPRNERFETATRTADRVREWILAQSKRSAVGPGGFGAAAFDAVDKGRIEEEEGEVLVRSMLTAGLDTTVTGLGASMVAFARFPDQWRALLDNPKLVRPAFDEVIRWASPVQTFFRTTTREVEVAGTTIPKDSKVLLFLASANHDETVFERPEEFDIQRRTIGHVGFGNGIHQCVGQMVAKLEAEVIFTALSARVARIELLAEPEYHLNNTVRAYHHVPVRVHPR